MTQVLSVTSECAPLVKTGGLADVAGALPGALAAVGVTMRTLMPGYPAVLNALADARQVMDLGPMMGGDCAIVAGQAAGLDLLVLQAPHLFERDGSIYLGPDGRDWPDNPERFSALCQAAARIAEKGVEGWRPDIVHGHDWQAGLTGEYLRGRSDARFILTIHNIAFHGIAEAAKLARLGLDPARFHSDGFEFYGNISALKAGLMSADALTTVSPTYARELMTPEFGMGLDGVMRARRGVLSGILNGIDTDAWDPAAESHAVPYKNPKAKTKATAALREELELGEAEGPLCVVVSRLTGQKGLDLLLETLPHLLARGGQLALLGSGDAHLEGAFRHAAEVNPGVSVTIGYDEALSHRMIAGGEAILVPSRFEPCGLTQLYGLRYGTVPLVALTGGLADTVIDANPAALARGVATGIQFHPITADALQTAIDRLCDLHSDAESWTKLQRNGMAHPVGWDTSAAAYAALYDRTLGRT